MSEVFAKPHQRAQKVPNAETIPKLLEENDHLLSTIAENFNKGRIQDALMWASSFLSILFIYIYNFNLFTVVFTSCDYEKTSKTAAS